MASYDNKLINGKALKAVKDAIDAKADVSHGNHVPATEVADNAKFLRNDNSWQTVTPANIGAVPASEKGVAGGVAGLGVDGKVPKSQLPADIQDEHIFTDTTAGWSSRLTYVPARGDIIIYTDKSVISSDGTQQYVPGVKIGDGNAYCVDLPFVGDDIASDLLAHISDVNSHVTTSEKTFWNNKLNVDVSGEALQFNRN